MTVDIRTAAQREAEHVYPPNLMALHGGRFLDHNALYRKAFIEGAVWAQARVTPTRDDIADALAGAYDEWCALLKEFLAGRGKDPGSEYEYKADAILALLAGLAEGK